MQNRHTPKPIRFVWRLSRNLLSAAPATRRLLFPRQRLAASFGPGDVAYAWRVFSHHETQLERSGYGGASTILEVGPGRNVGTALLWWSREASRSHGGGSPSVVLWDVFENAQLDSGSWQRLAEELYSASSQAAGSASGSVMQTLRQIAQGQIRPDIAYVVGDMRTLLAQCGAKRFQLVYSHAAMEHAWHIQKTWQALRVLTAPDAWHSHRIDLADHGSRDNNYIEMLEWSESAYWLTMRFIPGATNRWRASRHIACLKESGFEVIGDARELRPDLPVRRNKLAYPFRDLDDVDLRTTAVDIVARLSG